MLHAIAPAPFGGAETAVVGLVGGLHRMGWPVELVAMADARSGPFLDAARTLGVPVHVLDSRGRHYLRDVRGLRAILRSGDVHVVHTHGYRADILGWWAARSERRAVVCTAHGFTGGSRRNRLNQYLGVQAMRRADVTIAVSDALGHALVQRGVPAPRVRVLPNAWAPPGVPLARTAARHALGLDGGETLVGWVGRVSPEKGPDLAVSAVAGHGPTLVMIGDGPGRAQLERETRGRSASVRWLGARPDAWSLLAAFDVLLLSSRTEGTPMILLEAMHAGVPIVATRVGGVPALLDETTAWLAQDTSPPAIREAVHAALANPGESRRRAANARERLAQRYATEPWVQRHMALYQSLARPQGAAGGV